MTWVPIYMKGCRTELIVEGLRPNRWRYLSIGGRGLVHQVQVELLLLGVDCSETRE